MTDMFPVYATIRRPSGFSDPEFYESEVKVLQFVYGKHRDAAGYDKMGECTLAVCAYQEQIISVPIAWLVTK